MKKLLCVILATIMIVCGVPFTALAETIIEDKQNYISEEEYIYYSDLFYGYSTYLTTNTYLSSYEQDTSDITTVVLNEYINTGHFTMSAIVQGISVATDATAIAKHMSDKIGLSSFELNKELDSANVKFAEAVCNVNLSASSQVSKDNAYVKNLNSFLKIAKYVDEIAITEEAIENDTKPKLYKYFFDLTFAYMEDYFTKISPKLPTLKEQMYAAINETAEISGVVAKAADFTKALVLSLAMQETQMELIDDIIATQPTSSTLYKGMTRLESQLEGKFIGYFAGTYCTDLIYEKVAGYVPEIIEKSVNELTPYIPAAVEVVKIINNLVLKGILGFDYSEYTSAIILTEYANNLNQSIKNKARVFSSQFDNSEIKKFETLYNAYIAMKIAAYEECKNLAEHNELYDDVYMDGVKKYFYIENAYQEYINAVKIFIMQIPKENRVVTYYDRWNISSGTIINEATDRIESLNCLYTVNQQLNITTLNLGHYSISVPENTIVIINGNIEGCIGGHILTCPGKDIYVNGILKVFGNIQRASITNNGQLEIDGNLNINTFIMDNKDSKLTVAGDLSIRKSQITDGTVILNGTEQQSVSCSKFCNLYVNNIKGIKCGTTSFTGEFLLNGNPLDNNGSSTYIDSANVKLDSISDYKTIILNKSWTLDHDLTAEIKIEEYAALNIPENKKVVINGNIMSRALTIFEAELINSGNLVVSGNVGPINSVNNKGILEVLGDVQTNFFYMSDDNTELSSAGDLSIRKSQITDGAVILNGTEQQSVSCSKAPKIILENKSEEGVVFNSSISPSVLFDHKGNNFTLYNNGAGSNFADYDGDGIKDNVDPVPTVFNSVGDTDFNGEVNASDLVKMRKQMLGLIQKFEEREIIYDMNKDGTINICDLVALKKFIISSK